MSINGLEITDVIIFPIKTRAEGSRILAYARVIFNDVITLNGVQIVRGKRGIFMALPSELNRVDGKRYEICFPITAEMRRYMIDNVLNQFQIVTGCVEARA
jgi:DNA-binding cell septation regulator SpoVG